MIDHETGDIIETYPDQPTYLRTFQPVSGGQQAATNRPPIVGAPSVDESTTINVPEDEADDEEEQVRNETVEIDAERDDNDDDEDDDTAPNTNATFDDSLAHPCPPPLTSQRQIDQYNQSLLSLSQQQTQSKQSLEMPVDSQNRHHHHHHYRANLQPLRPMIPPPHQNKQVYFGPAEQVGVLPSNFGFPLYQQQQQQQPQQQQSQASGNRPLREAQRPTISPVEANVVGERQFTLDDLVPHLQHQQQQLQNQTRSLKSATKIAGAATGGDEYANKTSIIQSHDESLKRALEKLEDFGDSSSKTDLIIVIEPEEERKGGVKVTRTNAAKASILLNAAKQYKAAQQQQLASTSSTSRGPKTEGESIQSARSGAATRAQPVARGGAQVAQQNKKQVTMASAAASASTGATGKENTKRLGGTKCENKKLMGRPNIEAFHLYGWLYTFIILLALSLSSLIIYLLVVPLQFNCTLFRPSYTHVSLILSSCNLIFICIFSLFWYCSEVTRSFYANLSSSAFIISTYSILVCLNLSLGILFFMINTCHLERSTTPLLGPFVTASGDGSVNSDGFLSKLGERNNSFIISYNPASGIQIERLIPIAKTTTTTTSSPNEDSGSRNRRQVEDESSLELLLLHKLNLRSHSNSSSLFNRSLTRRHLSDFIHDGDNSTGSEEPPQDGEESDSEENSDDSTNRSSTLLSNGSANLGYLNGNGDGNRDSEDEEQNWPPTQPPPPPQQRQPPVNSRRPLKNRPSPVDGGNLRASQTQLAPSGAGNGSPTGRRRIIIDGYQTSDRRYSVTSTTTSLPPAPLYDDSQFPSPISQHHQPPIPKESPWEAAWEYSKEKWFEFRVKFFKFLTRYDLRFIGALHALCAICLQYLAIKVASVRSHYCSPQGGYCI